jgi:hypothetical protein
MRRTCHFQQVAEKAEPTDRPSIEELKTVPLVRELGPTSNMAETPKLRTKTSIERLKAIPSKVDEEPKRKAKAKARGLEEPEVSGRSTSSYMDWYLS